MLMERKKAELRSAQVQHPPDSLWGAHNRNMLWLENVMLENIRNHITRLYLEEGGKNSQS